MKKEVAFANLMITLKVAVDTEFQPITDNPTLPISIQLKSEYGVEKFFLHPDTPIPELYRKHPVFTSPFALIDYFLLECRERPSGKRVANTLKLEIYIFFSFKDLEFLFADREFYRQNILPNLQRNRRISNVSHIILPWDVKGINPKTGKVEWQRLSLVIKDISAMQGTASLKSYSENVGIVMPNKGSYSAKEKGIMMQNYLDDPMKFQEYALGDTHLIEVENQTIRFYNMIAELIGIEKREKIGMSTGKIVATILTSWLAKQVGVSDKDFWNITATAGSEGITSLSRLVKNKALVYLAMVDGGRAVKERVEPKTAEIVFGLSGKPQNVFNPKLRKGRISGYLNDIDISSCYGSGLRNQKFAIGSPTIISEPMSLGDFLKKYESQLIPGLWYARISWDKAPFNQDLLISKMDKQFTNWDMGVSDDEDGVKVYDASMVLTTRDVSHAALNHDLLQCLKPKQYGGCSSNDEWGWLKKNATIETAAIYMRKHKVGEVTPKMLKGLELSNKRDVLVEGSKNWVEVDLTALMKTLISERKKAQKDHGKKSPLDVFLKLIINTIYGVTASEFFSEEGTGVSNAVVGNNITARARALSWLMAKGLHSHLTVTDGGVFDVNKVLSFGKMSLHLLEGLCRDEFTDSHRNIWVSTVPLFGNEVLSDKEMSEKFPTVDQKAWEHLRNQFPGIDILKESQFSFESKNWYKGLTIHSKVDYRLTEKNGVVGDNTIALRGMVKVWDEEKGEKVINPVAEELFDALEDGQPAMFKIETKSLLSLSDWKEHPRNDELLPHDEVSSECRFFSHTPLGERFVTTAHYKRVIRDYDKAKQETTNTALMVALVDASYHEKPESHQKATRKPRKEEDTSDCIHGVKVCDRYLARL